MTAKEVATKYFGANVFPAEITDKFLIHRKTTNAIQANIEMKSYRHFGYYVKSKKLKSIDRVTFIAVISRDQTDKFQFNNK